MDCDNNLKLLPGWNTQKVNEQKIRWKNFGIRNWFFDELNKIKLVNQNISSSLLFGVFFDIWNLCEWFQMAKTRQNISSPKVISRVFPWKFLQIHITSISGCLHFRFKICQTVARTSAISQFHEFLNLVFGGFLQYHPIVHQV